MISAGAQPVTLGRVWVGETLPSPELLAMCALSDPEDDFPTRAEMPQDQDDRETTETLVPETDREAPTSPENEAPLPRDAIRPEPADPWDTAFLRADDSVFSQAVKMVANAGRRMDEERVERKASEDAEQRTQRQMLEQQDAILAAIQRADDNSTRNYELLRDEIRHLKDSDLKQDERLKQGDKRFEKIEESIAALKEELLALVAREMKSAADKIEALEKLLAEAKANVTARQAPAPTG